MSTTTRPSWDDSNRRAVSGLLAMLAQVTDPRDRRGVRHRLVTVLGAAVIATLAGAASYRELGSQAADLPQDLLWLLDAHWCVRRRLFIAPSGSTLRRVLTEIDAAELDLRVGAWLREHADCQDGGWVIAIDGKVLRGSWNDDGSCTLFSAMLHEYGVVIGQVRVPESTTEVSCVPVLLEPMDITGALVTADAAHTGAGTARYVVQDKQADYLLCVKGNRPGLQQAVIEEVKKVLDQMPGHIVTERGHGRINKWSTWTTPAAGIDFPHAAIAACIRRDVLDLDGRPVSKEIALMISSRDLGPAQVHQHTRRHWGIENLEHYVRDTCWHEDGHQAYTRSGPHAFATVKNLAMSLLRLHGHTKIKETVQWVGRDRMRALPLIHT